jgi:hypothetical protein
MKKLIAVCLLLCMTACNSSIEELEPVSSDTQTVQTNMPEPSETLGESEPEPEPVYSFVWLVEPTLGYSDILYCCGGFFDRDSQTPIDEFTGELTDGYHGGHGAPTKQWIYDPQLNKFGVAENSYGGWGLSMYSAEEFMVEFSLAAEYMLLFQKVDSSLSFIDDSFWGDSDYLALAEEAYSGLYAAALGTKLLTDFIYTGGAGARLYKYNPLFICVTDDNGNRGVVGADGEVWVEFIFEDIIIIDSWTAFAKKDGLWGIIAFNGEVPDNRTSEYRYVNDMWDENLKLELTEKAIAYAKENYSSIDLITSISVSDLCDYFGEFRAVLLAKRLDGVSRPISVIIEKTSAEGDWAVKSSYDFAVLN